MNDFEKHLPAEFDDATPRPELEDVSISDFVDLLSALEKPDILDEINLSMGEHIGDLTIKSSGFCNANPEITVRILELMSSSSNIYLNQDAGRALNTLFRSEGTDKSKALEILDRLLQSPDEDVLQSVSETLEELFKVKDGPGLPLDLSLAIAQLYSARVASESQ